MLNSSGSPRNPRRSPGDPHCLKSIDVYFSDNSGSRSVQRSVLKDKETLLFPVVLLPRETENVLGGAVVLWNRRNAEGVRGTGESSTKPYAETTSDHAIDVCIVPLLQG